MTQHHSCSRSTNAPGSAPLEPPVMPDRISELGGQGYRVPVLLHGGHEHNPFPSPRMVKLFRALADGGADAVFNCHTHCPEGVEVHNGKPVIYSPGNFYFPARQNPGKYLPTWHLGYLTRIGFDEAGAFEYEPISFRFELEHVSLCGGDGKARFLEYIYKLSRPIGNFPELERLFDLWTLKSGFHCARGPLKRVTDTDEPTLAEELAVLQQGPLRS